MTINRDQYSKLMINQGILMIELLNQLLYEFLWQETQLRGCPDVLTTKRILFLLMRTLRLQKNSLTSVIEYQIKFRSFKNITISELS